MKYCLSGRKHKRPGFVKKRRQQNAKGIGLGVRQGSVLGSLMFILYIKLGRRRQAVDKMNEDLVSLAVPFCQSNKVGKKNNFIQKLEGKLKKFSKFTLYRSIIFTPL
jgi:hypothetical protein